MNRKTIRMILIVVLTSFVSPQARGSEDISRAAETDLALQPCLIETSPGPKYADNNRPFQGIPGLERMPGGRLWATWYAGGPGEGPHNYVLLVTSGDDGKTWSGPKLVIDPPEDVRAFDPCLWVDPTGMLRLFWAQGFSHWDGRAGVWAIQAENPEAEDTGWSAPRRLCDGIMMNKPTVVSTGEWLLPAAIWALPLKVGVPSHARPMPEECGSNVFASTDEGETWTFRGRSRIEGRQADEHMLVEKRDGSWWMLVRSKTGIGESLSRDRGRTWADGAPDAVTHIPAARFFIRRLNSGNLLLVKHNPPEGKDRSHLTAFLSQDDGESWIGGLMIDERKGVSYPDGVQTPEGLIYLIYDFSRKGEREILMTNFEESDILAGQFESAHARQRVVVNRATGTWKE